MFLQYENAMEQRVIAQPGELVVWARFRLLPAASQRCPAAFLVRCGHFRLVL